MADLKLYFEKDTIKEKFKEILGKRSNAYVTSALSVVSKNDQLSKATPQSVAMAVMNAATLNLPIGLDQAYIVPFYNNKKKVYEAQFQLSYKGLKQLAQRSGQFKVMQSKAVFEGQIVEDDSFLGYHFDWKNKTSDKVIGYASYFRLINGFESTFYMTVEECRQHASKYSQTYKNDRTRAYSKWETDFDKMAIKTVVKLHLNSGEAPLSVDMQRAIVSDQSVIEDSETLDVDYVDNKAPSLEETKHDQERENVKNHIENSKTLEELKEVEGEVINYDLQDDYMAKELELQA